MSKSSVPPIPVIKNSLAATLKVSLTSLYLLSAICCDTIFEIATGKPAIEMVYTGI